MIYEYQGFVCSDIDEIDCFAKDIIETLKKYIDDEDDIFQIRLIINELLINAALHGNHCEIDKYVEISIRVYEDRVLIRVKDEGGGIDYDFSDLDIPDLSCGGRGLQIVSALVDEISIENTSVACMKIL